MLRIIGFVVSWIGVFYCAAATVLNHYSGNEVGAAIMAGAALSTLLVGIYFATK